MNSFLRRFRGLAPVAPLLLLMVIVLGLADRSYAAPSGQVSSQPGDVAGQATIFGTVAAADGETVVGGATVSLSNAVSHTVRSVVSNPMGFFTFSGIAPGTYSLRITGTGFSTWTNNNVTIAAGEYHEVSPIILQLDAISSTVRVTASQREIAEVQIREEEKQRVLGIVPNFYVSYDRNAAPLAASQKIRLAWRTTIDPLTLLSAGLIAGTEQATNYFPGFGQGVEGYSKRFGAAYADDWSSMMMANALLPALFHQDPRYFYRGTGSTGSRILYAISSVFVCRGDNGRQEPNYSYILGGFAAGAMSNIYYPASERGAHLVVDNGLINLGSGAGVALLEEFVLRRFTHRPQAAAGQKQP